MNVWAMISTAGSKKEANKIARMLVKERLAACVTVIPGAESYFFWNGEISREKETMILVKTLKINAQKVIKKVQEIHSYQVPEILFFGAVEGEKRYLKWVKQSAGKKT